MIHRMLPEDEIFLCGLALLIGVILGIESSAFDEAWLSTIENQDNIFPGGIF